MRIDLNPQKLVPAEKNTRPTVGCNTFHSDFCLIFIRILHVQTDFLPNFHPNIIYDSFQPNIQPNTTHSCFLPNSHPYTLVHILA